jgi:hypothetical protein
LSIWSNCDGSHGIHQTGRFGVKTWDAPPMCYPCQTENRVNQPIPSTCCCAKVAARNSIGAGKPARRATFVAATYAASICAQWKSQISISQTATFAKPICEGSTCAAAKWRVRVSTQRMYRVLTSHAALHQKRSKCRYVSALECAIAKGFTYIARSTEGYRPDHGATRL